jgi:hypothetical protein
MTHAYFIIHPKRVDNFCDFIFALGYQHFRYDFKRLQAALESGPIKIIIANNNDDEVRKLNEETGLLLYYVGVKIPGDLDPFNNYLYTKREHWKDFERDFQKVTGEPISKYLKRVEENRHEI